MNAQIRRLGIMLIALLLSLFVWLSYWQVMAAGRLNNDPRNTRKVVRDFSEPRGVIQSADGVVLARSDPSGDAFQRVRRYPEGDLFGHLTGFFSFTYGFEGLEKTYNDVLTGRNQKLRLKNLSDVLLDHRRTADVTIGVSKRLQQVAQSALGTHKGAVVALDPRSGTVLALWSYPSFDPNPLASHDQKVVRSAWTQLNADPGKPLLPRAFRERYFPGSTFKVVTSATALSNGATVNQPSFPELTELPLPQSGGQTLKNFGGERCGGTLPTILQVSCNTAFAQLGMDLGAQKMSAGAQAFGFDKRPPLDLPGVATSLFPEARVFAHDLPGLAKSAIGQQDVQAVPLEMALAAAGVANGGSITAPHLMTEVRDDEGNVIDKAQPTEWVRAMSPDVASTLKDMMVGVVQGGTGTRAQIPGVTVAGKTGTAQTGGNTLHAWFIAFAPAEAPRVAVAVIVENQPNAEDTTGGAVAAPVAKAVLQAALQGNP